VLEGVCRLRAAHEGIRHHVIDLHLKGRAILRADLGPGDYGVLALRKGLFEFVIYVIALSAAS
jgi:hypothetical protein